MYMGRSRPNAWFRALVAATVVCRPRMVWAGPPGVNSATANTSDVKIRIELTDETARRPSTAITSRASLHHRPNARVDGDPLVRCSYAALILIAAIPWL